MDTINRLHRLEFTYFRARPRDTLYAQHKRLRIRARIIYIIITLTDMV